MVEYLAVLKASYDYTPTSEDEIEIKEDQLLFLLDNSDPDWSKVKLKGQDDDTPEGLVPSTYVEPAEAIGMVKAMYDYEATSDGELNMQENELLHLYERDGDWFLVKADGDDGKIGYVPGNYVEDYTGEEEPAAPAAPQIIVPDSPPPPAAAPYVDPAVLVAKSRASKPEPIETWTVSQVDKKGKKKKGTLGVGNGALFFASATDKTAVQKWPSSAVEKVSVDSSKHVHIEIGGSSPETLHFISKDASDAILKKIQSSKALASSPPTSPIRASTDSAPEQEHKKAVRWASQTDEIPPSPERGPSLDLDGDAAVALYDFTAAGDDELSVKEGDQLVVIDKGSDEWWKCRNQDGEEGVVPAEYVELQGGASRTVTRSPPADDEPSDGEDEAAAAEAERQRQREEAAAEREREKQRAAEAKAKKEEREKEAAQRKEAADRAARAEKMKKDRAEAERRKEAAAAEIRQREEKAEAAAAAAAAEKPRSNGDGKSHQKKGSTSRRGPAPTGHVRTWHDRTGQFQVEAEFKGFDKGKLRLHKTNGVTIEVPSEKMSPEDMAYVEMVLGKRTRKADDDDDEPLANKVRSNSTGRDRSQQQNLPAVPKKRVDWFEFFLNAGCDMDDCTRYQAAFEKDKIDEAILPDIKADTLRSLGLREGDIIRVLKAIEQRGWKSKSLNDDPKIQEQLRKDEQMAHDLQQREYGAVMNGKPTPPAPNLFTTTGGALKNNTPQRRGRPTPNTQRSTSVNVDGAALGSAADFLTRSGSPRVASPVQSTIPPLVPTAASPKPAATSDHKFDDDAWAPRPSSTQPTPTPPPPAAVAAKVATPPPAPAPPKPVSPPPRPVSAAAPTAPAASAEFDLIAKIGTMKRPPSAPITSLAAPSPPLLQAQPTIGMLPPISAASLNSGMGVGPSASPMGSYLATQPTGLFPQSGFNGPRGPLAPVPANQGLLNPLVPTTTGFGGFVPTRPMSTPMTSSPLAYQPTGAPMANFQLSAPTGLPNGLPNTLQTSPLGGIQPLVPQQTSFIPTQPLMTQPTGVFSGFSPSPSPSFATTNPTGLPQSNGSAFNNPAFAPMTPNPPSIFNAPGSAFGGSSAGSSPASVQHSPANVFASMKAGGFNENQNQQNGSDKYAALRTMTPTLQTPLQAQATGWTPGGLQPQATGMFPQQGGFGQMGSQMGGQMGGFPQQQQGAFGAQPTGFNAFGQQSGGFPQQGYGFQQ